MKKTWIALVLIGALLATCLTGCGVIPGGTTPVGTTTGGDAAPGSDAAALKESATSVFTLDVNPGIRIYVEADDTVMALEATNEDGEGIVAELNLTGTDYETAVELIIDKLHEKDYLEGDSSAILISIEKQAGKLAERLNDKVSRAFEKLGKTASVIEQELDQLDEEFSKTIREIAEKHHISEGKARLIEKIREDFPELSEQELAALKVNDLGIMLQQTSDRIKEQFRRIGEAVEDAYVGGQQALTTALDSLQITREDVTMLRVQFAREDGKMVYEVEFVYDGMEYEITVDAESGEILETESEEFEEPDVRDMIDAFCDKHHIDVDAWKDKWMNSGLLKPGEPAGDAEGKEIPSRGELLRSLMESFEISADTLEKTDVKIHRSESGIICSVTIETDAGDVYRFAVEAYTGTILRAELNGTEIDLPKQVTDAEETTGTEETAE